MAMKNPVHPGSIVKTCIEDLELTVTEAAKVLGVTRPTISKLVNEHAAISPEMAIRLSQAFGSSPEFWLQLQLNYDLAQARNKAGAIRIQRYMPKQDDAPVSAGV
jgi:addiction module HigA family antidote